MFRCCLGTRPRANSSFPRSPFPGFLLFYLETFVSWLNGSCVRACYNRGTQTTIKYNRNYKTFEQNITITTMIFHLPFPPNRSRSWTGSLTTALYVIIYNIMVYCTVLDHYNVILLYYYIKVCRWWW